MKKVINTMVESIKAAIIRDMQNLSNDEKRVHTLAIVLKAYNDFQESERDGVDYIFDLNNREDLKCCVEGGLTAQVICGLWLRSQSTHTPFFHFGVNHEEPKQYRTMRDLRDNLISWLDELLPYVIAYPYAYQSYRDVYTAYVTDVVLGLQDTENSYLSDLDALAELKRKMQVMD